MGATSFASWAIPKMLIDLKVPVIPGIKGSSQALMVQNPATMSIAGANYVPQSIAAATGARVITNGTMALSAPPTTINLPAYTDSFVPGTKVGNVTIFDKGIRYDYKETDVLGIPYNSIKVRNDSLTTAQRVANIQTSNQKSDGTTRVPSLIDPNAIILDKKQQNKHIPGTWQYLKENGANLIDGNPSNIGVRSIYCPSIDQEDYILELAENMHKYVLENGIVKTKNHKLDLAAMGLDEHTFNTSPDFANLRIDPIVLNQLHGTAIRQIRQNAGTGTPSTTRAFSSAEDIETPEIIGLATDPTVIREQTGGPVFYRTNGMSVSVVERNGQIEAHLYPNG